jgi:hypothetical protein
MAAALVSPSDSYQLRDLQGRHGVLCRGECPGSKEMEHPFESLCCLGAAQPAPSANPVSERKLFPQARPSGILKPSGSRSADGAGRSRFKKRRRAC